MTTDNQYGWNAFVSRCKAQKDDVPVIGTILLISDVLEVEQARSDAVRLAALVLDSGVLDIVRQWATQYSDLGSADEIERLARALVGDGAALNEVKHGMEHTARFGDEMPDVPPGTILEGHQDENGHLHFTVPAQQRR